MSPFDKQNKINEAVERGFLIKTIESDGMVCYMLTPMGCVQWWIENGLVKGL
jgi:hypothetical protein